MYSGTSEVSPGMRWLSGSGNAISANLTEGNSQQLAWGSFCTTEPGYSRDRGAETLTLWCCPFILIRSAERSTEVMNEMKRVDGDWAFAVQEVRAFKGSLNMSDSKQCGNKSADIKKEYGYKGRRGCRACVHGRQLPARQTTLVFRSPQIAKGLKAGRLLMVRVVYAWPVLALLRWWWMLWVTWCWARGNIVLNMSYSFDDYSWTAWPLTFF